MTITNTHSAARPATNMLVKICFATSLGAALVAGIEALFQPLPAVTGMLCVSAFYFVLGGVYAYQHRQREADIAAAKASMKRQARLTGGPFPCEAAVDETFEEAAIVSA